MSLDFPNWLTALESSLEQRYPALSGLLEDAPKRLYTQLPNEYQLAFNFDADGAGRGQDVESGDGGLAGARQSGGARGRFGYRIQSLAQKLLTSERTGSLIGRKIGNAEDAAIVSQIYRDSRFEVFRAYYLDADGVVVHETALTARIVNTAPLLPGKIGDTSMMKFAVGVQETADSVNASRVFFVHNHPSGNPAPSGMDINVTKQMADYLRNLYGGHVVINGSSYASIDSNGQVSMNRLNEPDLSMLEESPHMALGLIVNSAESIAGAAKSIEQSDGTFTVIGADTRW